MNSVQLNQQMAGRAPVGDEVILSRGVGKRAAFNGEKATVRAYKHGWARVSLSGGQREHPWRSGHWSARAGVSAAAERVGLLSLDRELIGAILGQVRQRKDVVRAAGSCRALRAVARGHSCWHSVEFVEQGSLGEMMAMCALRVPPHRVNLTFGVLEAPLVLHFLETCDTRKLEHLTLRRVAGFHFALSHEPHIDLSGPGVAFIASIEGRCEGASLKRSVRDCRARLAAPGARFLHHVLAATPHLRSFTCSNLEMADFECLPPLQLLESADLGATAGEPDWWPPSMVPFLLCLDGMLALTRLRLAGFEMYTRVHIRSPTVERLVLELTKASHVVKVECPRLADIDASLCCHPYSSGFEILDSCGKVVTDLPSLPTDFSFVPAPNLPFTPAGAGAPYAVGYPPNQFNRDEENSAYTVVELPAGCRVWTHSESTPYSDRN